MLKSNCWEYHKCGLEPGGFKAVNEGPCRAATESRLDGVNGGKNGGRSCWGVPDTKCDSVRETEPVEDLTKCLDCGFRVKVILEEKYSYTSTLQIADILRR